MEILSKTKKAAITIASVTTLVATALAGKAIYNVAAESNNTMQTSSFLETVTIGDTLNMTSGSEDTVSATNYGITIAKKVSWTSYNDKAKDNEGNPYIKVEFDVTEKPITTTEYKDVVVTPTIGHKQSADVVLVLDRSSSMLSNNKFNKLKKAAKELIDSILSVEGVDVKIAIVAYDNNSSKIHDLSADKNSLDKAINNLKTGSGTCIQAGLYDGQLILQNSKAYLKYLILMTDGEPNSIIQNNSDPNVATPPEKNNNNTFPFVNTNDYIEEVTNEQANILKNLISNLNIYTVGYDLNNLKNGPLEMLKSIATNDENGIPLFYNAQVDDKNVTDNLTTIFKNIASEISSEIKKEAITVTTTNIPTNLIDRIPSEFTIIEDTIEYDNSELNAQLDSDANTITWNYKKNIKSTTQHMSFIMKLNKDSISADYLKNSNQIYTNGLTIDINKDSNDSAVLTDGSNNTIGLSSPMLTVPIIKEDDQNNNDNSDQTDNDNSDKTDNDNSDQTNNDNSNQTGNDNSNQTGNDNSNQTDNDNSNQTDNDNSNQSDTIIQPEEPPTAAIPTPIIDPEIHFSTGEDSISKKGECKLFYMYFADNEFLKVEDIKFTIKTVQENATTADIFIGGQNINTTQAAIINNELITIVDNEGNIVPCVNNKFAIELNKEYTVKLSNKYFISQVLKNKAEYSINVIVNDKTSSKNIRLIKRETFVLY